MRIEIFILIGVVVLALFGVLTILFARKHKKTEDNKDSKSSKKSGKKGGETKGEKKVEPVYKKEEPATEQKKEEPQKQEQIKEAGFKIIRKKSKIKINKRALKGDSRNPSITKVFKDGKLIDEENKGAMTDITSQNPDNDEDFDFDSEQEMIPFSGVKSPGEKDDKEEVGRFGTRQVSYEDKVNGKEYQMKTPEGVPNRAPILTDRTNFASHLIVSDDNNLSGVSGTGIAKAALNSERQGKEINEKTDDIVKKIRQSVFGQRDMDFMGFDGNPYENSGANQKKNDKNKIDAKTMIIGEVVSKRKGVPKD